MFYNKEAKFIVHYKQNLSYIDSKQKHLFGCPENPGDENIAIN